MNQYPNSFYEATITLIPKPVGHYKSSAKRKVHSNIGIPQETRKISNRQPNFTPKTTGKRRTKKISRRKEIIKI